jgi:VWFA-related protein
MVRGLACIAILALGAVATLVAQPSAQEVSIRTHPYEPPSAVLRAEADLVETPLTVRDAGGHTVGGLGASDFEVLDNGVVQQITGFSELRAGGRRASTNPQQSQDSHALVAAHERTGPRYIEFFFDDLHTYNRDGPVTKAPAGVEFLKRAARDFIDRGVKANDWLSIATASGEDELDFTQDAKRFAEKFDGLHSRAYAASPAAYEVQTLNTIAALKAAVNKLSAAPGVRMLVMISHGFYSREGRPQMESICDAALRAGITVNTIYAFGLDVTPPELNPREFIRRENQRWLFGITMEDLAERTGGHFFKDTNGFGSAMAEAVYPDSTYLIAFRPGEPDGKMHRLKIRFKVNRPETLEFRQSYYSRREDDAGKKLTARAAMDDAVMSANTLREVAAAVTLAGGPPKNGAVPVSISINVDVSRLQFAVNQGRRAQQLVFIMALLDPQGGFVTGKESVMDLALTDAKLASLKTEGLKVAGTLEAPPGVYRVRTVVREGIRGQMATDSAMVELRGPK